MDKEITKQLDKFFEGSTTFEIVNSVTGAKRIYYMVTLSADDARQAQWVYSKTYNKALVEGIFTADEMLDILKRRNIIGDDFDAQISDLREQYQGKLVELELATGREEKKLIAQEASEFRNKLFRLNYRYQGPMDNTAEHLADQARLDFYTSAIVYDGSGKRVWDSIDAYLKDTDKELTFRARFEVNLWLEGVDSETLLKLPEAEALREIEEEEENERQEALKKELELGKVVAESKDKEAVNTTKSEDKEAVTPPPVPVVPAADEDQKPKRRRRKKNPE